MDTTTAAAAVAAGKVASDAGKALAKKADSYLGLLLKPSLELAGKELKVYLKERIDDWKQERRKENLKRHVECVREIIAEELPLSETDAKPSLPTIETAEAFEQWTEGAQDVDPDDFALAAMWQRLLVEIAQGKAAQTILIEKLRSISSAEANALLRFRDGPTHPQNEEEHYLFDNLVKKGLLRKSFTYLLPPVAVSTVLAILFTGLQSIPIIAHNEIMGKVLQWGWTIFWLGFAMFAIARLVDGATHGFAKLRPTWIGGRLLKIASALPNQSSFKHS